MAHEVDGKGNILVHTFLLEVYYPDGEPYYQDVIKHRCTDYAQGWNWVRQMENEIKSNDPDKGGGLTVEISIDQEWIPIEEWKKEKKSKTD